MRLPTLVPDDEVHRDPLLLEHADDADVGEAAGGAAAEDERDLRLGDLRHGGGAGGGGAVRRRGAAPSRQAARTRTARAAARRIGLLAGRECNRGRPWSRPAGEISRKIDRLGAISDRPRNMPQVIESMELAQVLAEAADIAASVNQKLTSAHQLLAFFTVPNRAEILLRERGVDEDRILAAMTEQAEGAGGGRARPARARARDRRVGRLRGGGLPPPPHRDEPRAREPRAPAPRRLRPAARRPSGTSPSPTSRRACRAG